MKPIRLPAAVSKLKGLASTPHPRGGDLIEIRQDPAGITLATGDGRALVVVRCPTEGAETIDTFTVPMVAFAKAATAVGCGKASPDPADRPLLIMPTIGDAIAIAGPAGEPQTITTTTASATGDIERLIGQASAEARDGGTADLALLNLERLRRAADAAAALGVETIAISFVPRLAGVLLAGSAAHGTTVEIAIAGIVPPAEEPRA